MPEIITNPTFGSRTGTGAATEFAGWTRQGNIFWSADFTVGGAPAVQMKTGTVYEQKMFYAPTDTPVLVGSENDTFVASGSFRHVYLGNGGIQHFRVMAGEWVVAAAPIPVVGSQATITLTGGFTADDVGQPIYWQLFTDYRNEAYSLASPSLNVTFAEPEPEPEPELGGVTGQDVAAFLGLADDTEVVALAGRHAPLVTAMARSYTRGRGFDGSGTPNDELSAVITCATARLVANPEQIAYDSGAASLRGGFNGWTLPELAALNRYRVRAG